MTKILLVDDREDNLLSIETILEPAGYQFVKANSGRQALKVLLSEYDFALILMDVKMPNLNGFETASLIYERERLRHIPIVFITAHTHDDEAVFKGYRTGAVDYIYKPINPDLLRAKVAVFVELYRKTRQLITQEQNLIKINKNLENEINERKISEEKVSALNLQLLQSIDKLEIANQGLDRFAFMASHDLQEPLRKIHMFTELLNAQHQKVLDDSGKKYIARIQSSTNRMQALISDILTFSKISHEEGLLIQSDLTVLAHEVVAEMEGIMKDTNATITVGKLPSLLVNPTLIRLLFVNLLNNAIKYSKKGVAPVIKINAEFHDNSAELNAPGSVNKYCRIIIEDNGIGFQQEYSEQIFEMFKRLHPQSEYEGTGIGLALCKKIVEVHQGYISAKSKPGEGSSFTISLPVSISKS